ncbi:MAG: hypothetical protein HXX13_05450 [Bacteroidetes bacterium]|nr:hypothetical protein [Bacteroidota bacterium]
MKKINIILVTLVVLIGSFAMQSCKKDNSPTPVVYKAAVPLKPAPEVGAVLQKSGTDYTLTWEGAASTWDVYAGPSDPPALVQEGVAGNSYTFSTEATGTIYWKVVTKDVRGIVSTSPVWSFFINTPPSAPTLSDPADNAVDFAVDGTLAWDASDPEGDDLTFDVYLSTTNPPVAVATGLTAFSYAPAMEPSTKYFWKVVAKDSHGKSTSSAIQSFTTGLAPIMTYTGNYLADEPAENYSYDVTFVNASATSVSTDNYWNSGWTAVFEIDFTNLTYTMPYTEFSSGYAAIESGIVDPTTGKMTGTYTIWHNGVNAEQGVHTYTKK